LTTREIQDSVKFLTKIADVTVAVDMKNTDNMLEALQNLGTLDVMSPFSSMLGNYIVVFQVDETLVDDYWRILHEMRTKKLMENKKCSWLTYFDIDDCINETQAKVDLQNQSNNLNFVLKSITMCQFSGECALQTEQGRAKRKPEGRARCTGNLEPCRGSADQRAKCSTLLADASRGRKCSTQRAL
jgi:hypothetical protein